MDEQDKFETPLVDNNEDKEEKEKVELPPAKKALTTPHDEVMVANEPDEAFNAAPAAADVPVHEAEEDEALLSGIQNVGMEGDEHMVEDLGDLEVQRAKAEMLKSWQNKVDEQAGVSPQCG